MSSGFLSRSDKKRPTHLQTKARILKFWIEVEEDLYYLCSETKGADQLCSCCTADVRLCFCIGKNPVFSLCNSSYLSKFRVAILALHHVGGSSAYSKQHR